MYDWLLPVGVLVLWYDWLLPVGVLVLWFVMSRWILPRLGVPT